MSKTPEEMAEEYIEAFRGDKSALGGKIGLSACRLSFLAGYKAAMEQLADASKVMDSCEHILHMEKMVDVNSPEKPDGWVSVKDRLPEENEEVLVFGYIRNAPRLLGVRYRVVGDQDWKYTWQGDGYIFKQDYITHWMPLPEPPKEEK